MRTNNRRKNRKLKKVLLVLQCIVITAGVICVALICTQEIMGHITAEKTDAFAEGYTDSEQLAGISKESEASVLQDTAQSEYTEETEASESKRIETETVPETEISEKTAKEKKNEVLANRYRYPEKILGMMDKNMETVDFVYDYLEKRGHVYTSQLDLDKDIKSGEIPLLIQWDERWGYGQYGENIVATSGCGPTCMAMVIAGLTGNTTITPYTLAVYSEEWGYLTSDGNTTWSFITEGGKEFGVQGQTISLNEETVTETLAEGNPIICSVGPGDFTDNGHFIVLVGCKDGKIKVNDPYSYANSEKLWEFDVLQPQIKNLWKMSEYEID